MGNSGYNLQAVFMVRVLGLLTWDPLDSDSEFHFTSYATHTPRASSKAGTLKPLIDQEPFLASSYGRSEYGIEKKWETSTV